MHQQQTAFENIVGKEEIAHNEQFLLFSQCFLLNQIIVPPFVHIFDIISLLAAALEEPTIAIWGKGLTFVHLTQKTMIKLHEQVIIHIVILLDFCRDKTENICRQPPYFAQMKEFLSARAENILQKEKMLVNTVIPFPKCFQPFQIQSTFYMSLLSLTLCH